MRTSFVFGFVIVLLYVGTTDALKCYTCNLCNDPFDANAAGVTTNDTCVGSCTKSIMGDIVSRGCGDSSLVGSEGCHDVLFVEMCTCNTDLCNSSSSLTVSFIMNGFLVAIGLKCL